MGRSANLAELPDWASQLLEGSRVGRLGVVDDDGVPRVLPITFALCGERLVSVVDQKPKARPGGDLARVRWLRARPGAALTVDHYEDDWSRLAWVQAIGRVRLLDAASARDELAALSARYPQYVEQPPPGPVIALEPYRFVWWRYA